MNQTMSDNRTSATAQQQQQQQPTIAPQISHASKKRLQRQRRAKKRAQQQSRSAAADRKYQKLQLHGLFEHIGNAANEAKKTAGEIDQAIKFARTFDQIKDAIKYQGSGKEDFTENAISRLEDLGALICGLMNAKNYLGFLAVIQLYTRTHFTKSVSKYILGQVSNIFESGKTQLDHVLNPQSTDVDPEIVVTPEEKLQAFKECVSNWRTIRHGAFSRNVAQLVNIFTTFGWTDLDENPIKLGHMELFRARVWDTQKDSLDFMDLIINTFTFFVERGYLAFAYNDLSLLLYSDAESARFESEYSLLVACDGLMETGRLEDLKTETINGEADFEQRLDSLIMKCTSMIQTESNPAAKTVLTNRLITLKKLRSKLIMLQKQSPVRTKPYGVSIYGGSAVGKSMINAAITKILLSANGFESTKQHVVTLNDSDPYQSEYRSYHNAVTMDDFGNTKADKYDGSPTAKIIDFLNNVPKAALSPIAELKGNVMIRPKLVSVTTNVKTLLSNLFSNEPVSILRRFDVHLDVRLRDTWIDPETGGINTSMLSGEIVPDAWIIDLQRVKIIRTPGTQADDFEFETILKDASLRECIDWMIVHSAQFYAQQASFVESTEKFYEMQLCSHYENPEVCPKCKKSLDVQANEGYILDEPFEDDLSDFDPIDHIPVASAVENWYRNMGIDRGAHYVATKCKTLQEAFEEHKSEVMSKLAMTAGGLIVVYGAFKLFKAARGFATSMDNQARNDGVPEVLPEDHVNYWKKAEVADIPKTHRGATTTGENFEKMLKKRIAYCTVYDYAAGKSRSCNIFPICGNTWLLPGHMIDKNHEVTVEVRQGRADSINRVFKQKVDETQIERFGDDFLLIRLVNGGSIPNSLDMIVQDDFKFSSEHVKFCYKDEGGTAHTYTTKLIERRRFVSTIGTFDGYAYRLPVSTECGMCIAPIYTYRSPHQIIGFHLAGITNNPFGVSGAINATMIMEALAKLNKKNTLECHSEADMPTSKYGKDFSLSSDLPSDHAVTTLGDIDGQPPSAIIYGAHDLGRSFFTSEVRKSPISDVVKEVMQIERVHGPPQRGDTGKHWLRDINLMSHPKGDFSPRAWNDARSDLLRKCTNFLESHPTIVGVTYPIAHDYVMAGADGIAAYSRIPLNTSMGWPLNKKKSGFIGPVEREVPGITEPIDFNDPIFREEIERMKETLARGERIHTVFRGNLKDEPTKWTKDKIRVFAGCEVAFTCIVREFYLPIVRLIQGNWKQFECAVGINAHGPQWAELTEYITRFGEERIIAGDYAAFDKSASPMAMMSAFDILIQIAKYCGYSDRDLTIMRGIATEISYPIYELDGIIMQLFGSNPSGHPLTVIINNLMNQLYMRYVYYSLHEGEAVPDFDEVISLICYGDDNIMSVSEKETKFTMSNIIPVLSACGIKYTKADKTEVQEGDDFESLHDVEFLKRGFVMNPAFGAWTAALDINSIGKSLHNQMASKVTPREVIAAQAIQSANAEFAFHGPDEFHKRQPQLYEVARRCGLTQLVGELPSLEMLVERYHGTHLNKSVEDEPILEVQARETVFDEPTSDEVEQYVRKTALFRRLQQFNRLETKKGKQVVRQLRIFRETYGDIDITDRVEKQLVENSRVVQPYMSEEHQLRELQDRMENYGFSTVGLNVPLFGDPTLGEIDGLFEYRDDTSSRVVVLVEAKMSGNRTKGLAQLGRYGLALAVAGADGLHVRTVLMTGRKLEAIGEFGTSNFEFPPELQL